MELFQNGVPPYQDQVVQGRRVGNNNRHKLRPDVLSKVLQVVTQANPAPTEKILARPVIQPQQLEGPSTGDQPFRICTNYNPFQNASRPPTRVPGQEVCNRLRDLNGHIMESSYITSLTSSNLHEDLLV